MRAGATNFLCKPVGEEELSPASPRRSRPTRSSAATTSTCSPGAAPGDADARERQVLDRVVAGRLNKQTAMNSARR
jgi:FixJ family two-component response regulator